MKHPTITLALLLLLFCTSLMAQEMSVKSFEEATTDLTARTQPRQDLNGNDCALIKVQIAAPGVTFDGNVMGDVAFAKNEYRVYMPEGSKRLKVIHPSYVPLKVNFADYGISSLHGKTTYILTLLLGEIPQGVQQPKVQTGWIILDSDPQGASVYINDDFVGNTPLTHYKTAYGTYSYRLEHPKYHAATGTVELNSGRIEKTVTLLPAFGTLSITSNVNGAKVTLDGNDTGKTTPCTIQEVASGEHTVTVQMEKYAPTQQRVVVEDGKTAQVNATLSARFAKITIQSLTGAQIYCNGEKVGTTQYSDNMMEGYYDLEVRLPHHKSITRQIQVVAGQPQQLTLNPIPIYGSLDVVSNPHAADVEIDGKAYGKTPLTVEQLLEGEHQVTVSKDGFVKKTISVKISDNETGTVNISLSKLGAITVTSNVNGAKVMLDGKDTGKSTPCTIQEVALGQHQISVSKDGYVGETVSVNVSENGTATVNVSLKEKSRYSKTCPDGNHPHMIDLGLPSGTKWACCNVGASKPEEDGGYYAWGETETKSTYSVSTYQYYENGSYVSLGSSICGTQYDVAHVKWGGSWQMPTLDNIKELLDQCKSEWTTQNGVSGRRFTGPNGGSIFLPASGCRDGTALYRRGEYGDYWSGTQNTSNDSYAYFLFFDSVTAAWSIIGRRSCGLIVRPVAK